MEHTYKGKGNHSVNQLESICEEQKEAMYQNQLMKQEMLGALKGAIDIVDLWHPNLTKEYIEECDMGELAALSNMRSLFERLIEKASKD